nr:aminotransferase class IV [Ameyamaea chiangmaiensis]
MPADQARIDPADRGFTLGEGLFETMRVQAGTVPHIDRHMARLAEGATLIGLPRPDDGVLRRGLDDLLRASGASGQEGAARLTVTHGPGVRGLAAPTAPRPTVLITLAPLPPPAAPARLFLCQSVRRDQQSVLSRIKSLNYLPSLLARREAEAAGADEALLTNLCGDVAETSVSTVLAVRNGVALTPRVADGALPGIARARLLDAGLVREGRITPHDLLRDGGCAVLLVNALSVRTVASLNGQALPAAPAFEATVRAFLDDPSR